MDLITLSPMEIKKLREHWNYVSKPANSYEEHQKHKILLGVLLDESDNNQYDNNLLMLIEVVKWLIKDYEDKTIDKSYGYT